VSTRSISACIPKGDGGVDHLLLTEGQPDDARREATDQEGNREVFKLGRISEGLCPITPTRGTRSLDQARARLDRLDTAT
jgi:hypothetical protein